MSESDLQELLYVAIKPDPEWLISSGRSFFGLHIFSDMLTFLLLCAIIVADAARAVAQSESEVWL